MASGWLKERLGNTKRRNPTISYYYCWEIWDGDGYKRHQVYVPMGVVGEVRRLIEGRISVEATLEIIHNTKMGKIEKLDVFEFAIKKIIIYYKK